MARGCRSLPLWLADLGFRATEVSVGTAGLSSLSRTAWARFARVFEIDFGFVEVAIAAEAVRDFLLRQSERI